jgi:hypothetical protein
MKHRFYGDKKDYIKYGLLRVLSSAYKAVGVNWYLTDDHHGNQNHGNDIRYLDDESWKYYSPAVFSALKNRVKTNQRNVSFCKTDGVVQIFREFIDPLPTVTDQAAYSTQRSVWHTKAKTTLTECDLVFLDPDIGVRSQLPSGALRASEYSSHSEISDYEWCDLLVVQFLQPRNRFQQLESNPVTQHAVGMSKKVVAFIASSLALLYVSEKIDAVLLKRVFETWDTKIGSHILVA